MASSTAPLACACALISVEFVFACQGFFLKMVDAPRFVANDASSFLLCCSGLSILSERAKLLTYR